MIEQREKIQEAVSFIRTKTSEEYPVGIVLGTGLGALAKEIDIDFSLDYGDIPYFPISTVETHHGKLIFGTLAGKKVVAMQGRFHFYEGYSMHQIVFPIRVMKLLGVKTLGITNACGGLNPGFSKGDIMLIDDHINMLGGNPLIGPNDPEVGPRFPDMCAPYSPRILQLAEKIALENQIKVQRGVYVALSGPCLETRAEYRMLRTLGADVVGMSTVPEVIAAVHQGTEVFGMSIITDECFPDNLQAVSIEEIIEVSNQAEPKMTTIFKNVVAGL
ncbi:MAG: purine-nucleoside phosphorylase [Prosthecochloris sp.]|uniref:Purine nucleoside phosphorylase n=1 Tax=Prosthecochloris aestuarii (strain DSM 271 / SK 413) TaxID=290512 RepID=B4S3E0_PROA2|nr:MULTISPECIES: purine-nucleoside phosphorylase [Prosthecochloris]ACF46679.1 purine nucleoside phosphorylase I, inosine and guanosine-specific [Prosthecochloris aestuarii DSM 271]MCW8798051.1 purine-nucleoside phosphorylase [Prosthecochloris sp.]NEX11987.1 purine-nucleoside phosphorylase [Prosthecochloris sp.]RDD29780.1 purine-nucleoside phosphorylase [Prosthecochloris sp. ZM]